MMHEQNPADLPQRFNGTKPSYTNKWADKTAPAKLLQ